jgi:hypothetical protein
VITTIEIVKFFAQAAGIWALGFGVGKSMAYVRALINAA